MMFDFDHPPERRDSDSLKWAKYAGSDVLPMWVADMDFAAPPCVIEALQHRVAHGVFGYGIVPASLTAAVMAWLERAYGWLIEADWITWLPGLVTGLNVVCRSVGEPGDAVLTATPIYPPFLSSPLLSGRERIAVPLHRNGQRWHWDLAGAEAAITPRTRLLMLCNPHNPVGRAFDREELADIADLAVRHDLIICADEIHADLMLTPGRRHVPIASLDSAIAARTITLMAPSKTFNIPGLGCSFAVVSNPAIRRRLRQAMQGIVPDVNVLGFVAAEAAYRHGDPWRCALIAYLRENAARVYQCISSLPGLKTTPVEATYLAWIDVRGFAAANPHGYFEAAGVGLSDGADFGAPGFLRLNFGCARSLLTTALERMRVAVERQ